MRKLIPIDKRCLGCGKTLNVRSLKEERKRKYCHVSCQRMHDHNDYILKWKLGKVSGNKKPCGISAYVKRYLFDKYDNKCAECGWNQINLITKRIPLEIHHIDGNWKNTKENNLILLCPNCHSLTFTFGRLNYGNGRI